MQQQEYSINGCRIRDCEPRLDAISQLNASIGNGLACNKSKYGALVGKEERRRVGGTMMISHLWQCHRVNRCSSSSYDSNFISSSSSSVPSRS